MYSGKCLLKIFVISGLQSAQPPPWIHTIVSLFLSSSIAYFSLLVFSTSCPSHCKPPLLTTTHYHHLKQRKPHQHHAILMEAASVFSLSCWSGGVKVSIFLVMDLVTGLVDYVMPVEVKLVGLLWLLNGIFKKESLLH